LAEYLGYAAGVLTTFCYVPQLIRVFSLKSAREISFLYTIALLTGVIIWLLYGIFMHLAPIILWNSISFVMIGLLLLAKLMYGKQRPSLSLSSPRRGRGTGR
jgi:MtN3 and saliva related transmembrane protein